MLIAAAVRAPTSVAIALFTFAVSAASLVNSPVVRFSSDGCLSEAQALRIAAAIVPRAAFRTLRLCRFIGAPSLRKRYGFVIPGLQGIEWPFGKLRVLLLFHLDAGFPVLDLALGLILRDAVTLLDLADEVIAVTRHLVELVVGQL